jgi:hypothetical protein
MLVMVALRRLRDFLNLRKLPVWNEKVQISDFKGIDVREFLF